MSEDILLAHLKKTNDLVFVDCYLGCCLDCLVLIVGLMGSLDCLVSMMGFAQDFASDVLGLDFLVFVGLVVDPAVVDDWTGSDLGYLGSFVLTYLVP